MNQDADAAWQPSNPQKLARQFTRLGWVGFWTQLALLIVPLCLLIYVLTLRSDASAASRGVDLSNYLSIGGLLVLLFTTIWFFTYTRLGPRIAEQETRPSRQSVEKKLWVGIWAACGGLAFSVLLLLGSVGRLVGVLLANPQTGLQLAPPVGGDPTHSLSAIDGVSLAALVIFLAAELLVLAMSLWLLFRVSRSHDAA